MNKSLYFAIKHENMPREYVTEEDPLFEKKKLNHRYIGKATSTRLWGQEIEKGGYHRKLELHTG